MSENPLVTALLEAEIGRLRTELRDATLDRNAHLQRAERALAERDELLGLLRIAVSRPWLPQHLVVIINAAIAEAEC